MNRKKEPTKATRLALSLCSLVLLTLVPFATVLADDDARYAALGDYYTENWAAAEDAGTARYEALAAYHAARSDADSARWAALGDHFEDRWAGANDAFGARYAALANSFLAKDGAAGARYAAMADSFLAKDSAAGARYAALGEHFARMWAAVDNASTARYTGLGDYYATGGSDFLCNVC